MKIQLRKIIEEGAIAAHQGPIQYLRNLKFTGNDKKLKEIKKFKQDQIDIRTKINKELESNKELNRQEKELDKVSFETK